MKKVSVLLLAVITAVTTLFVACVRKNPSVKKIEFLSDVNDFSVYATQEVVVPDITYTDGATLSVAVTDPSGAVVEVNEKRFTPATTGNYRIAYTITLGKLSDEKIVNVTVVANDILPELKVGKNEERVLLGTEVVIAVATATDAIGNVIKPETEVKDPSGNIVTVTDGKFTPELKGVYTITYSATDVMGKKTTETQYITVYKNPDPVCEVPADVKNSFETEAECALDKLNAENGNCEFSRNDTSKNADGVRSGAYSLKANFKSGSNINFVPEAVTGNKDFSGIGTLSFWVYNHSETALGMSIFKVICSDNTTTQPNVYKSIPPKTWWQFSVNLAESGLTENSLKSVWAVQFWVGSPAEIYFDDIVYDSRADYVTMGAVEKEKSAKPGDIITIETPEISQGATLTVEVTDPEGAHVAVNDKNFTVEKTGEYKIVYTADNGKHSVTATTTVTVAPESKGEVPAEVKNSFETEAECALDKLNAENGNCEFSRNDTSKNADGVRSGAYSLKANFKSGSNINFVPEAVTGNKDFSGIGTLSFWVYNHSETALGMSIFKVICSDNTTTQPNVYKSIPPKTWWQFSVNLAESGLTENSLKSVWAVQFWVGSPAEIYFDDIVYDSRADYVTMGAVEKEKSAKPGDIITIETPEISQGATLTVEVTDPEGAHVAVNDKNFTVEKTGEYKIVYTADNGKHSVTATTTVTVAPESKGEVPVDVKNSFETEAECALDKLNAENGNCEFSRNDTSKNADGVRSGAYSLKANFKSGSNINFVPEAVTGNKDFSGIGTLSFWVYNHSEAALGMSIFKVICSDNTTMSPETYKSIPAKTWWQFSVNLAESDLTENSLKRVWAVQFWVGNPAEIYFDDIVYDARPQKPASKGEVPADVKNSFETEAECALDKLNAENGNCEFSRNDTSKNADGVRSGAYSLKANFKSGSNINFVPEAVTGNKDFSGIGTLSFWVYNHSETALGMSIFKVICSDNTTTQPNVYKSIPPKTWWQFSVNLAESGLTENSLKSVWAVQFWVGSPAEIYFDDIVYDAKA